MKVPKSLNPYYMHRISIPVQVPEISLAPTKEEAKIPLPPIIFRLQDKDSRMEELLPIAGVKGFLGENMDFLGQVFPTIGTVAVKHPVCLDRDDPALSEPAVDLNSRHKPYWHA